MEIAKKKYHYYEGENVEYLYQDITDDLKISLIINQKADDYVLRLYSEVGQFNIDLKNYDKLDPALEDFDMLVNMLKR